ncbi:MAG: hypothetical protein AAGB00_07570 [Planctomycetota bacterium]
MTRRDIEQILRRRPFEPLRFYFVEGDAIDVRHPELVWLAGQTIFFGDGEIVDKALVSKELGPIYGINFLKKIEAIPRPDSSKPAGDPRPNGNGSAEPTG